MSNDLQQTTTEKDKGFTLIELLVVVVIIGILAAVAIPIFLGQKQKAVEAGIKSDIKNASSYMETYFVDVNSYEGATLALLEADGFKASTGNTITLESLTPTGYCIEGTNSGADEPWHLSSADGAVVDEACP